MAKKKNLSNKKNRLSKKNSVRLFSFMNISYVQLTLGLILGMILGSLIVYIAFNTIQDKPENQSLINSAPSIIYQKTSLVTPTVIPTEIVAKTSINKQPQTFNYIVQKGDNFAKLGKKFCGNSTSYLHLMDINPEASKYGLHPGDIITVSCE